MKNIKVIVAAFILFCALAAPIAASKLAAQGDPSQWGVAQNGDPSQWGVAGDPSQW